MVLRAQKKLYLDAMVTGRHILEETDDQEVCRYFWGHMHSGLLLSQDGSELLSMIKFGAERIFQASEDLQDDDLDGTVLSECGGSQFLETLLCEGNSPCFLGMIRFPLSLRRYLSLSIVF